ncbi:MAG TPA: type II secretion system protein [Gemmatimonadaceae bacterium]|nr:type II secretion system protein [Gemmatimonadaceae bacterium]
MLTPRNAGARPGLTLVELMVAVTVAGVVLSVLAVAALRQQRFFLALVADAALTGQLRDAASVLPTDLRAAAVGSGDLREATDTSIEVRETISSGVVCDTLGQAVVLAPAAAGAATFAAVSATIETGDAAWVFSPDDSVPTWREHKVLAVGSTHPGQCSAGGPRLIGAALSAPRTALTLDSIGQPWTSVGRPIRVTRPIRFSLYRATDGNWYLGARDWNNVTARFNAIQPLAGPFQSPAAGPLFRWVDSTGAALATPVVRRDQVALARIVLRGRTRASDHALGAAWTSGPRGDSASISVAVRNRP